MFDFTCFGMAHVLNWCQRVTETGAICIKKSQNDIMKNLQKSIKKNARGRAYGESVGRQSLYLGGELVGELGGELGGMILSVIRGFFRYRYALVSAEALGTLSHDSERMMNF